ncbi:MAG TPA: hypothetical protein PKA10_12480 [Selenomonadales bacterium]|nr:hypothetical protein [Selenomonadales bacterium]
MKKKVSIMMVVALVTAGTAFAAPNDQPNNENMMNRMYQYCNEAMKQWGNGNAPDQGGKPNGQAQSTSYHGGMMGGNYDNMMDRVNFQ